MRQYQRAAVFEERLSAYHAWQDRIRNPSLSVLLILQLCLVFLAAPLTAKGLPMARVIGETLVLAVVALVVILLQRRGAFGIIVLSVAATLLSIATGSEWSAGTASVLRHGAELGGGACSLCSGPHHV